MSDVFQVRILISGLSRPRSVLRLAVVISCLMFSAQSYAERSSLGAIETQTPGATNSDALARLTVSPVKLSGGSSLTVVSPAAWSTLNNVVGNALSATHHRLSNLLGPLPAISTSVRLMTSAAFTHATGAPEWTNALYVRGQILIPIGIDQINDHDGIRRSVSHEYTHAVVAALSSGRAPGWLDEGLAQWIEGEENPILKPALYEWLSENDPIPLERLQGGFTKLPTRTVPAAYAQSLLSSTIILNTFGFSAIRKFFDGLADGESQSEAMSHAFNASSPDFEERLYRTLKRWYLQQRPRSTVQAALAKAVETSASNDW